ncbi:MAG: hypothetical protein Q8P80_05620 [Candidatus Levybacteria bacterium]|nr:hypothetical protein [Candidatus Levybacteria bacterium]
MLDQFFNLYSKYPWVAIVIISQWIATTLIVIQQRGADTATIMGITLLSTVFYAFFGFKPPKG